ncbi:MAG: DUF2889 domain-containing protein [Spongiibacteraceae bacterium]
MSATSYQLPNPRGHSPLRKPNSFRRTTSIDVTWPTGRTGGVEIQGLGRDSITPDKSNTPIELSFDELYLELDHQKNIQRIRSTPALAILQKLAGVNALGELRSMLNTLLFDQRTAGAPLYQILNDVTGCMVAADWAWASRKESFEPEARAQRIESLSKMEGVCTGFSPNSSALHTDGTYQAIMAADVIPLAHPQDPEGWHALPPNQEGDKASFRRARRIDLWLDSSDIYVESTFQDSASTEAGGRKAVHEYTVVATFDRNEHKLQSIKAIPHILPFPECPAAVANLQRLVGVSAVELREEVSRNLRKVHGCTHLNDAARALAETPTLFKKLLSGLDIPSNH